LVQTLCIFQPLEAGNQQLGSRLDLRGHLLLGMALPLRGYELQRVQYLLMFLSGQMEISQLEILSQNSLENLLLFFAQSPRLSLLVRVFT
jgi:hypothetical protein